MIAPMLVSTQAGALIGELATTSLGAIWASTSPDFGEASVVERFGQTRPRVLFAVDGYRYNGKAIDCLGKVAEIARGADLYKFPRHPYTGALLSAVPHPDPRMRGTRVRTRYREPA